MQHAKLSPSSAHRWLTCTAAPMMEQDIPDPPIQAFTQEGIDAHNLAEWILKGNKESKYKGNPVEDREALDLYLDYVETLRAAGLEIHIENKMDLSKWIPEGFGTTDCVAIDRKRSRLYVVDLKFGKGYVEAEGNEQLKAYALGALEMFPKAADIVLVIVMPRVGGGIIERSVMDVSALMEWGVKVVKPQAREAWEGLTVKFAPSERACQWCKARDICKPYANQQLESAREIFGSDETFNPDEYKMTPAEIAEAIEAGREFRKWFDTVEDGAYRTLEQGGEIPGYKLVEGRARRGWAPTDDELIQTFKDAELDEEVYLSPATVRSVAQVEKRMGKKDFAERFGTIVETKRTKPAMVSEDDPREGIDRDAEAATVFAKTERTE